MAGALHSRSTGEPAPWDTVALPQGDAKVTAVRQMFDTIAPRYDMVNRIMTFRLDVKWRRTTVDLLSLAKGSTVVDLAAGTGDLCLDLETYGHHPLAFDLSYGMLAASTSGAPRVQADILRLPLPDASVDGATCGFALRNLVHLQAFFDELGRVVRRGGARRPARRRHPAQPAGALRQRRLLRARRAEDRRIVERRRGVRYLPRSVAYLPTPEAMIAGLHASGFTDTQHIPLSGGITQLLVGTHH